MAMRYPKLIKSGSHIGQLVMNVDMCPTMLTLAGVKPPAEAQGRSVLPLFKGPVKNWRTSFLSEYFMEKSNPRVPSWQAVRDDQYKYIHYTELDGMDELYDLESDPFELRNLVAERSNRATLDSLQKELRRLLDQSR